MSSVINETKELLDRKNIKNSPTCQQPEALPWVWATGWNQECNRIWERKGCSNRAQETTANEHTKPMTKRLHLDSKIKGTQNNVFSITVVFN